MLTCQFNYSLKMSDILFSVVVPLYNKVQYIERTIESVLRQTYQNYELIVVDDGSTDGSFDIANRLLDNDDERKILISQANAGVSMARNKGAELANGDYICFLDSDDWWEPTFLEEMDRLIDACPGAGMYGTGFYLIKNGKKRVAPIGVDNDFVMGYINYCQVYARTLCMPISSSSVAMPRTVFNSSGKFRSGITLGEDFDLWIRVAIKYQVALVNKPLANYFQDVPIKNRATRKLRNPKSHMLWNLDYLRDEEGSNTDLKVLMDRLRASGLQRFYLSHRYHKESLKQLAKIDWNNVSPKMYRIYHSPLFLQRICFRSRTIAVYVKQLFNNMLIK